VRKVAAHRPDVGITDVRMPPGNTDDGLRAAREIRERFPGTAVVVRSQYVEAVGQSHADSLREERWDERPALDRDRWRIPMRTHQ